MNSDTRRTISVPSAKTLICDKNSSGWSWLERWVASRPWENRLIEQTLSDSKETTSKFSEPCTTKVRKNNVTKRISAKPPVVVESTHSSSSQNSELQCDDSSASSSFFTSKAPVPRSTLLASDSKEERYKQQPNYMTLTESTKGKLRNHRIMRQSMVEFNVDSKSSAGSDCSLLKMENFSKSKEQRELLL